MAVCAAVVCASQAADFTVSAGSSVTLSAAQAAECWDKVYVNDDLTIDGTICDGLTNLSSITIGASATHPVAVVITNGAKWIVKMNQTMTFTGKGGTIVASAPRMMYGFGWGVQVDMSVGKGYTNGLGGRRLLHGCLG